MIKIYDKSESEMMKIESSKKYLEDVKPNHVVNVVETDESVNHITAVIAEDGTVILDGRNHVGTNYYCNIYELLVEFPIIAQYQNECVS